MIRTLADLVAPGEEAHFLHRFVKKERCLFRTPAPGRAEGLLPWAEIDRLFAASAPAYDGFRVMINGNKTEPRMYRERGIGAIRTDALLGFARQGATFVINGIHNYVPAIDALVASIERRIGCPVWANCYASFGDFTGFLTHTDTHDVLILQVWGAKRWRTYGTPLPHPIDGMKPPAPETVEWEDILHSGDVLYVPRGEFHAAVPEATPSVHLTIGMLPARGMTFMQWLGENAGESELLRSDIGRGRNPHQAVPNEAAIKRALHDLVDRTPIGDFLAADDRKRPPRRVAAFGATGRLRENTLLASALRRQLDLETSVDEAVEVEIGGNPVRLSAIARRALQILTASDLLAVSELAAKLGCKGDDDDYLACLDELARNALISIEG